jgi:hypothetical protein
MPAWGWHESREPGNEGERRQLNRRCSVRPRLFELETDASIVEDAESVVGEWRTQDVAAQSFAPLFVIGGDTSGGL